MILLKRKEISVDVRNVIGERVEMLRKERGLTQKSLADELSKRGVPISTSGLSKLEKQIRKVTDIEIVALAEIFEVSVNRLLDVKE
ncbi:MAG: helix-turn-helix transcriptional regulator [Acutalibacteraceae bacterium]|nr:helix-turn-helix transcriptional regulator [Acutalibacteraceae bacterium]